MTKSAWQPAYTDADVQAAAEALRLWDDERITYAEQAAAILDVVAPGIAARALSSAAVMARQLADHGANGEATPYEIAEWLDRLSAESAAPRQQKHAHSFESFSRVIEWCDHMHYYCACGEREPCVMDESA